MTVENTLATPGQIIMRTTTTIQRGAASTWRTAASEVLHGIAARATHHWSARRDNLWLTAISAPLALTATGLLGQWVTWPLVLLAVAACSPGWRWSWLFTLELAFVSTDWAYVGTVWLASSLSNVVPIGLAWAAFPLALAGAGAWNRHRHNRPEAYFSLTNPRR